MRDYEHDCDHNTRFVSYPEEGEAFCTMCEIERLKILEADAIAFGEADILLDRSEKDWPEDLCETHCRTYEVLKQHCRDLAKRQYADTKAAGDN